MDTTYVPDLIRDGAPRHATRLQLESATRMSQRLTRSDAVQKRGELFTALDDFLRALKAMQAVGASSLFLEDCVTGAIDQARNAAHAVDLDLRAAGLDDAEPIDLSDLYAFWESVR